jgi:starch synthase (maltosyl-transferring)
MPSSIRVEDVRPRVDGGDESAKRCVGDEVRVSATVLAHGTKVVRAAVRFKSADAEDWNRAPMREVEDEPDRFEGTFVVSELGHWDFGIEAWTDPFALWQDELRRKHRAGQADLSSELSEGASIAGRTIATVDEALELTIETSEDVTPPARTFGIDVDPMLARFGAWYELFPRSFGGLKGVQAALPRLAELGFDVVYLPPIHPIGTTNRKGPNNSLRARAGDPGSPWAIGASDGGHTAVHQELGTLDDFDELVEGARVLGLEIALDLAFQASPDHPWLAEHPEWFRRRPDGTVKFAENPPKRYEDIVNFDLESEDWQLLWNALADIVDFWIDHGVRVFRVDNPHTKPLPFWAGLLRAVRREHPEVIFLAEAFTRPAVMQALAKVGFQQSYTYFTWRNTKAELIEYMTELAGETKEYFRPNFFVNTPDILHAYLQSGGRPAFHARLVLAATLSPSYGIYSGFESSENTPREAGSEEYRDSEKYEAKARDLNGPLMPFIGRLNAIRHQYPVFQHLDNVSFLESAHDSLLVFAKGEGLDAKVVCVNIDTRAPAEGVAVVPPELGLPPSFVAHDLLTGARYPWRTGSNYVLLPPGDAHVMSIE